MSLVALNLDRPDGSTQTMPRTRGTILARARTGSSMPAPIFEESGCWARSFRRSLKRWAWAWFFRPHDGRPPWRRPHRLLRVAGNLLWVAVVAGLLWWSNRLMEQFMEFVQRGGR